MLVLYHKHIIHELNTMKKEICSLLISVLTIGMLGNGIGISKRDF